MDTKELIFNMYKDKVILAKEFRTKVMKKFKLNVKEVSNLYARITKYQINKYGNKLNNDIGFITKEERSRRNIRAKMRRRGKTHPYWENTKANRKTNYL